MPKLGYWIPVGKELPLGVKEKLGGCISAVFDESDLADLKKSTGKDMVGLVKLIEKHGAIRMYCGDHDTDTLGHVDFDKKQSRT